MPSILMRHHGTFPHHPANVPSSSCFEVGRSMEAVTLWCVDEKTLTSSRVLGVIRWFYIITWQIREWHFLFSIQTLRPWLYHPLQHHLPRVGRACPGNSISKFSTETCWNSSTCSFTTPSGLLMGANFVDCNSTAWTRCPGNVPPCPTLLLPFAESTNAVSLKRCIRNSWVNWRETWQISSSSGSLLSSQKQRNVTVFVTFSDKSLFQLCFWFFWFVATRRTWRRDSGYMSTNCRCPYRKRDWEDSRVKCTVEIPSVTSTLTMVAAQTTIIFPLDCTFRMSLLLQGD